MIILKKFWVKVASLALYFGQVRTGQDLKDVAGTLRITFG